MQYIYNFFENYSHLKQLTDEKKLIDKVRRSTRTSENFNYAISRLDGMITKEELKDFKRNDVTNMHDIQIPENTINYYNFGEMQNIESKDFDIFKFESIVGKENTLSIISIYVFMTEGLYSCVNYANFENFLKELTKGYSRSNSYHTVIKK